MVRARTLLPLLGGALLVLSATLPWYEQPFGPDIAPPVFPTGISLGALFLGTGGPGGPSLALALALLGLAAVLLAVTAGGRWLGELARRATGLAAGAAVVVFLVRLAPVYRGLPPGQLTLVGALRAGFALCALGVVLTVFTGPLPRRGRQTAPASAPEPP